MEYSVFDFLSTPSLFYFLPPTLPPLLLPALPVRYLLRLPLPYRSATMLVDYTVHTNFLHTNFDVHLASPQHKTHKL